MSGRKRIQSRSRSDHAIHPIQMGHWKRQLLDGATELFTRGECCKPKEAGQAEEPEFFWQICKIQMELVWLKNICFFDPFEVLKLVVHYHLAISICR